MLSGHLCHSHPAQGQLPSPDSRVLPQPQDEPGETRVGKQRHLVIQAPDCQGNFCKELGPARPRKCVIRRGELLPAVSGDRKIVLKPQ